MMPQLKRIAFVGNSLPRRCGIATFTADLYQAVSTADGAVETCIVAMNDAGRTYNYPHAVQLQINAEDTGDYLRAAEFLNERQFDVVSLQHEYGIFGGEAGAHILLLLSRLTMPVVTTLHTVLSEPTKAQLAVMLQILKVSSVVVVMAEKARELLRDVIAGERNVGRDQIGNRRVRASEEQNRRAERPPQPPIARAGCRDHP